MMKDPKQENRLHMWQLEEIISNLHEAKMKLFQIEVQRAQRYGRTDKIAIQLHEVSSILDKQKKVLENAQRNLI